MRLRTYVDAGVLIAAARGTQPLAGRALTLLEDPSREFITSDYLRMEIVPKPTYHRVIEELAFYDEFFRSASTVLPFDAELLNRSFEEACRLGLSAFDAIHLTAAVASGCEEFLTSERMTSPLFRATAVKIVSLHSI
jgi:predicted nucleic acid-binding protein